MSQLKKIIHNCKQATVLIEKRMVGHITFREYIVLRIHQYGCSMCRLYDKQSQIINDVVQQLYRAKPTASVRLDDRFKQTLQSRIDEELNKK
jgi:hypothetical protein